MRYSTVLFSFFAESLLQSSESSQDSSESDSECSADTESSDQSENSDSDMPGPMNEEMEQFLLSLDRDKVSTRAAFRTSASFAKWRGLNPRSLRISRTTLQRKRQFVRAKVVGNMKATFKPKKPLAVHWDEIKVAALGLSTRLPTVVTGIARFSYNY